MPANAAVERRRRRASLSAAMRPNRIAVAVAAGARALSGARALAPTQLSSNNCFGGQWRRFQFESATLKTPTTFSVFTPPQPEGAPCLFYLSGPARLQ